ncbi:MAG: hypothetical protein SFU56_18325 [Capsulimonadales bacterium]|nr:hypothetical protein [Capsulimonadales bacterium]
MTDLLARAGLGPEAHSSTAGQSRWIDYINLKLAFLNCPPLDSAVDSELYDIASAVLSAHHETQRLLFDRLCPADQRIQSFLDRMFDDCGPVPHLPARTFVLDRYGLARILSLPPGTDEFKSEIVHSYRLKNGVLHNPKSDRRTTEGIFHVADCGLPIPDDKRVAPKGVFLEMLRRALAPPASLKRLPFTSGQTREAECLVSLLLRPIVCPEVPGFTPEKTMEIRFFVPGNLVCNLDFVESIFGNAGDPILPENDAALDTEHWTGHTGCVILAPHLVTVTKKQAGLPHWDYATERQRHDRMCWKSEDELYNDGVAFKLTCRDEQGVIVTIIADNYFGYCKKEVKTQISFAANLYGFCEEEHAGGALVVPSYDLGEEFSGELHVPNLGYSFREVVELFGDRMDVHPDGYAVDRRYPDILYVQEDVRVDLAKQRIFWTLDGTERSLKLLGGHTYVRPTGYRIQLAKFPGTSSWRLVGTRAEGTFCHKPCTVSGGGKSEISKPITDAILQGPVFVADFRNDFDQVEQLINRSYSDRFRDPSWRGRDSRTLLSPDRSLGSVIKMLTPSSRDFSDEYNEWLRSIPQYIKELVFVVKRVYKPEWNGQWREHFGVDVINGTPGNELRFHNRRVMSSFLRVGYEKDGSWRTFGLRKDFHAAFKLAQEDDISASVIVPLRFVENGNPEYQDQPFVKFVRNCEYRLFQRPDDAVRPGYDQQTEADFVRNDNFLSNYEPLTPDDARELTEDTIGFDAFTAPMREFIREVAETDGSAYFACSAHPRLVDGKPTKNPRYLQVRPDVVRPRDVYLTEMAIRMHRRIPLGKAVPTPVDAVLPGRRNNPPDHAAGIPALAVFNPIHYLETPELFMEFISSMTGKSPSTTGAGSEGALTKAPFNALLPILDLNNAFVSHLLTGVPTFITAAGYVGPHLRVDHDISLLVPEVWCRMSVQERDPSYLMANGYLEKCEDFEYEGRTVLSSRLGYRITRRFVRHFFGRIFNHPQFLFTEEMLRPEKQDQAILVEGVDTIVRTHRRVAEHYFRDGSIDLACPPLRVLLHIMRDNAFEGKTLRDPEIRSLFTRESLLASPWYAEHVCKKQAGDIARWERNIAYLEAFLARPNYAEEAQRLGIPGRLEAARRYLAEARSDGYRERFLV